MFARALAITRFGLLARLALAFSTSFLPSVLFALVGRRGILALLALTILPLLAFLLFLAGGY
ncbi:MAG: hypothetical protein AUJ71_02370 [Candidatus Omnitrophica bacterium CG1_02_49_16]|nr:MAG: hypothetical protein AUJ71_02370 [Candidatus Omnitrophica bacterium CG1_02_49_16]